jgi:hypothetical protein
LGPDINKTTENVNKQLTKNVNKWSQNTVLLNAALLSATKSQPSENPTLIISPNFPL